MKNKPLNYNQKKKYTAKTAEGEWTGRQVTKWGIIELKQVKSMAEGSLQLQDVLVIKRHRNGLTETS